MKHPTLLFLERWFERFSNLVVHGTEENLKYIKILENLNIILQKSKNLKQLLDFTFGFKKSKRIFFNTLKKQVWIY